MIMSANFLVTSEPHGVDAYHRRFCGKLDVVQRFEGGEREVEHGAN